MSKSTLHSRIEAWLLSIGARRVATASSRYKRFALTQANGEVFTYWLGKAGALRAGPAASTSHNIAHRIPATVLSGEPTTLKPIALPTLDQILKGN